MNKGKLILKAASIPVLLIAIAWVTASSANLKIYETDFIKSITGKFATFYSHAQQDRVYVQTDKSFYTPGETIWFTAYVRDAQTLKPSDNSDIIHVELITPKGTTERHYKIIAKDGAARGDFDLSDHPGGIYKLKAYTEWQKNEDSAFYFEKEITVQNVVMPRLKMKLDFAKKAYGKGDEVEAKLELNTNAGKPLSNTMVKFTAQVEGKDLRADSVVTDGEGKVNLRFFLPVNLNSTDGTVNAMIDFEGSTESVSRSIPIVLNKIKMEFFPEGGDLVTGLTSRIAFRATNEQGRAADIEGIVVDTKGAYVTRFSSYHFGMGEIHMIPKPGETYRARITKPVGILDEFNLPESLDAGYVLSLEGLYNDTMHLSVQSFQPEELSFIAQTRGKIYASGSFYAQKGSNSIAFGTRDFPIGISQVTLFDSKGIERCERLVFVNKNKQLKITISTDKQQYKPREEVNMTIKVTDEKGLPMPGNFSLAVVDDNLLSFADDKQGNILSKMLLEPELKEKVEEPNFYFDAKEPKADKALDLLMMTSGWRHYTWKRIMDGEYQAEKYRAEKYTLIGKITDTKGEEIPFATILLLKSNEIVARAITDEDGNYMVNVAGGTYSLRVSYIGYETETIKNVNIYSGSVNTVNVSLKETTQNLNEVMVVANARDKPMREEAAVNEGVQTMEAPVPYALHAGAEHRQAQPITASAFKVPLMMDLANKPADAANAQDYEPDPTVPDANGEAVAANYSDNRVSGLQAFDKRAEAQGKEVTFYRAKEFPVRKYEVDDLARNDFASTVYWNGNITIDHSGKAKVSFITDDLISSFKATLEGFAVDGSIGRAEHNYITTLPFAMDAKIPVELVSGDKMMIPVFVKNSTAEAINGKVQFASTQQLQLRNSTESVALPPHSSKVVYVNATATSEVGDANLEIKFASDKYHDDFTRHIHVVAKGFPANISLSGQDLDTEFVIHPEHVVPGSMKVSFRAYPNIMSELMNGVASILREPNGCFEQTSSSNYPNIMALEYLKSMKTNDPPVEAKAMNLLDKGYKKLTAYETRENGYEWFGAAPPHEALTAYGLMEFKDMEKVYGGVDPQMVTRTANLLLSRRDGAGGFKKNPKAIDAFGRADDDVTNAYIVYALTEAGYKNEIRPETDALYKSAKNSGDPYIMALCANAMFNIGNFDRGAEMILRLLDARGDADFWTGKKHSITRSTGEGLKVETTSLVLLALMKSPNPDGAAITSAVKFLVGARSGAGGFGSTQATILALKALTAYAEFSKQTDEAGTVEIFVNGIAAGSKDYAKGEKNDIVISGLEKYLNDGQQKVEIRFKGCSKPLPYAMNIEYSTNNPQSSKLCVVNITTKLSSTEAKVGETVRLSATLKNVTSQGQPMTMAIIGVPAGFSAQPWQLKEMQEKGVFDFYEITGNNIAFYYRSLAPNAEKQINLDLKAEIPGEYDAPASSAYLYYTNELKSWVGLSRVSVVN